MAKHNEKAVIGPQFMSMIDRVEQHAINRPNSPAFIEDSKVTTWREIYNESRRFAQLFDQSGVVEGTRVGILCGCTTQSFATLFGLWIIGAVAVPISSMLTARAISTLLQDSGAEILVFEADYIGLQEEVLGYVGISGLSLENSPDTTRSFQAARLAPASPAVVIYSSGTTGDPKGILHSHGARVAIAESLALAMSFTLDSVGFLCIPIHSNGSILSWAPAVIVGSSTCLQNKFDTNGFFSIVAKYQPTHGFLIPTLCQEIVSSPLADEGVLTSFECAVSAGAPMSDRLKERMRKLTDDGLAELWGLTEGVATVLPAGHMAEKGETVGLPVPGVELRIVSSEGIEVPVGDEGEIVGRSTSLMNEYWKREDLTKDVIWRSPDGKVFLKTGDLGSLDDDGYLTIRGRIKDMLISGGINVYPVDIERELIAEPGVKDAAVFGVPDDKWGERPVGVVIPDGDHVVETLALKERVNSRLARHQRIVELYVWKAEFPRNAMGKVLKKELARIVGVLP